MKEKILIKISLYLPLLLWAGLIFHLSSGNVPIASDVYWQDFAVKKSGHVLLFGILAVLIYRTLRGEGMERKKAAIWAVIISTVYGATDEYHQIFTQGREARVRDVFIDGLGAGILVFLVYRFLPNVPQKLKKYFQKFNLL